MKKIPHHILPVLVFAQFTGTSLWFAGNAVVNDMIAELQLLEQFVGFITMAVQTGFIIGTLVFAFLNLADRFSPVKVFLMCSLLGALANISTIWCSNFAEIMIARVATGFFLAGIYPVGMKIASDWHKDGLGKALGYLVGALVLGTAFPHLLKFTGSSYSWHSVLIGTSILSTLGGLLLFATVKDGPYHTQKTATNIDLRTTLNLFKIANFRSAAFGYFGHMWELYTFWAFVPIMLAYFLSTNQIETIEVSFWSFLIIGIGGLGCAIGGHLSAENRSKHVAMVSLFISGICCLTLPFSFSLPLPLFLGLMLIWGFFVIPDSPQFSTLVAKSSPSNTVATGLTIVNSLGFALTIVSIQIVTLIWSASGSPFVFLVLLLGPLFGFFAISAYKENPQYRGI